MDFFAYFDIELRIGGTVVADGVGNEAADSGAVGDAGRLRRRRQEAAVADQPVGRGGRRGRRRRRRRQLDGVLAVKVARQAGRIAEDDGADDAVDVVLGPRSGQDPLRPAAAFGAQFCHDNAAHETHTIRS